MPVVPNTHTKEEAAAKIALVRSLIEKGLKDRQISERTGYTLRGVHNIRYKKTRTANKRPYGVPAPDKLDLGKLLGIVRYRAGVVCTRCDERRYLIAKTGICMECECLNLIRQGVAKVINETQRH